MEILLSIPIVISILATLFILPAWIKRAKHVGLVGKDMHKVDAKEKVAEAGGVSVIIGFILGVLSYIAIKTFYFKSYDGALEIFSLISLILIVAFIGFTDDIVGWKIGLSKTTRIFFLIFASFPIIVINAGKFGVANTVLGASYPLILMVIGIVGACATFNFLAGYNGLETSQGILLLSALTIVTYLNGTTELSLIGLIMIGALGIFYLFNRFPAKTFPGDVLTYAIGGLVAVMAIFGHIEKIAVFFFIPYILETLLKLRGKLKKESFAKVNADGSLEMPYDKVYGLEHLAIYLLKKIKPNKKVYEKEVVYLINIFQLVIIIVGFIIFKVNPFSIFSA